MMFSSGQMQTDIEFGSLALLYTVHSLIIRVCSHNSKSSCGPVLFYGGELVSRLYWKPRKPLGSRYRLAVSFADEEHALPRDMFIVYIQSYTMEIHVKNCTACVFCC